MGNRNKLGITCVGPNVLQSVPSPTNTLPSFYFTLYSHARKVFQKPPVLSDTKHNLGLSQHLNSKILEMLLKIGYAVSPGLIPLDGT